MTYYHYILEGKKIVPLDIDLGGDTKNLIVWGKFMHDNKARTVGKDTVDGTDVSTVFLGIDNGWGEGQPILFETMTFGKKYDSEVIHRYHTWDEAEAGHKEVVQKLKDGVSLIED